MSNKNSFDKGESVFTAEAPKRLDAFVCDKLGISREPAKQLIISGAINVNGKTIIKPSLSLTEGDTIVFTGTLKEKTNSLAPASKDMLDILMEDEYLMIINKQAGVSTHPPGIEGENTIANALVDLVENGKEGNLRPGIVHRLDKDTTGLLIIAKTHEASEKLTQMISLHEVGRKYLALCYGSPRLPFFQIKTYLERDKNNRLKMRIRNLPTLTSKEAITNVALKEKFLGGALCLLELTLETGRTHQIRAHLGHNKIGIIGDATYSPKPPSFFNNFSDEVKIALQKTHRQMLHAYKLEFIHPFSGKQISIEATPPQDFTDLLNLLRS